MVKKQKLKLNGLTLPKKILLVLLSILKLMERVMLPGNNLINCRNNILVDHVVGWKGKISR